jgi:hypothetical protein
VFQVHGIEADLALGGRGARLNSLGGHLRLKRIALAKRTHGAGHPILREDS